MDISSDENSHVHVEPSKLPEIGGRNNGSEIRSKRRALSLINHNIGGVHRPVTRKCSYQIRAASKHTHVDVDAKKLKTLSAENKLKVWEDIPLTDEEQVEAKNQTEPMSLELSDTEINQMDEIEMEDIFEEPILYIDGCDAKNPLAAVDYVEDIYAYYKKVESSSCVSPDYMSRQFDINERMRAILIDWLIEVHHKFELREETLFLTVNIIDRFLEKQCVARKKLQLVGLVAMLLACKYEEVSVPVVEDLIFISDRAYKRAEVLEMESLMLNTLQFNMSAPTAYVFLKRFLKAAGADERLERVSFFLVELCLVEYEMVKHSPSAMAAAAVYAAQCTLYGVVGLWSKTCVWHSTYAEDQLMECARAIVSFHQKAASGKLTGVHRKYSTGKYGYAAKTEPAAYLLQTTTIPPQ